MHRYLPGKDFPAYAHRPGQTPHPKKEGGHSKEVSDPIVSSKEAIIPLESEAFLFGVDLFNHDFFWEAHVYWEALWHAVDRKGPWGNFYQGLIKLAASRLKRELSQEDIAYTHFCRSIELLSLADISVLKALPNWENLQSFKIDLIFS